MINAYYVVDNKKYLDSYLIRKNLELSKSAFQHLLKYYSVKDTEIVDIQNKKLYSVEAIKSFVEEIINDHEPR